MDIQNIHTHNIKMATRSAVKKIWSYPGFIFFPFSHPSALYIYDPSNSKQGRRWQKNSRILGLHLGNPDALFPKQCRTLASKIIFPRVYEIPIVHTYLVLDAWGLGGGIHGWVLIVGVPHPALLPNLALGARQDPDLAHLPEWDSELLKEGRLVVGEPLHQSYCAGVVEQRFVGCKQPQAGLEVLEVLVIEGEGCHGVLEELDVGVEVGGLEGAVVSAAGEELASVRFLVLGIHLWVDPVGNAGAVTLADCVRTCANLSQQSKTTNYSVIINLAEGFHPQTLHNIRTQFGFWVWSTSYWHRHTAPNLTYTPSIPKWLSYTWSFLFQNDCPSLNVHRFLLMYMFFQTNLLCQKNSTSTKSINIWSETIILGQITPRCRAIISG